MMQNAYLYKVYKVIYNFIAIIQLWRAKTPMASQVWIAVQL